jgi:ribosome-associated toxin RatA of RatAB toxin-antitoxin module
VQHEHTEDVAASPDAVYAAISNVANLPRFVPQTIGVRPAGKDRVQVDARYEGHEQHGGSPSPACRLRRVGRPCR